MSNETNATGQIRRTVKRPSSDPATHINEREFQDQLIELARLFNWRVVHFRPARTIHGWRTPVQGDGKGFPDTLLLREGRLIVAELKADKGKPTIEQEAWLDSWKAVGAESYVWRPGDLEDIVKLLR